MFNLKNKYIFKKFKNRKKLVSKIYKQKQTQILVSQIRQQLNQWMKEGIIPLRHQSLVFHHHQLVLLTSVRCLGPLAAHDADGTVKYQSDELLIRLDVRLSA